MAYEILDSRDRERLDNTKANLEVKEFAANEFYYVSSYSEDFVGTNTYQLLKKDTGNALVFSNNLYLYTNIPQENFNEGHDYRITMNKHENSEQELNVEYFAEIIDLKNKVDIIDFKEALNKEWVQISADTITGDSIPIFERDLLGNPLNIKKFMIIVFHAAKEGDETDKPMWLHIKTQAHDKWVLAGNTYNYKKNMDSTHKLCGELWQNWKIVGAACSGHYTTITPSYPYIENIYGCRPEALAYIEPITAIRLTYDISGTLNAGSKIEIWGLKA